MDTDIRRVSVVREAGTVAAMVVDREDGLRIEVGPLSAMRRLAAELADVHDLVQAQTDVWERRRSVVVG